MTFREWLTQKYVTWRGNAIGRERTQKEFADWIGVTPQVLSTWMTGTIPESRANISLLIARFGLQETYSALNIPLTPDDQLYWEVLAMISSVKSDDDAEAEKLYHQIRERILTDKNKTSK